MTFVPEVFPSTFSVLYCPLDSCDCDAPFSTPKEIFRHLETEHSITVHNTEAIVPILDRYLANVAKRNVLSVGGPEDAEDAELRLRLQSERLSNILERQQYERGNSFKAPGQCLFCPEACADKYSLFSHMYREHSFNIGQLDNLVLVDEFLGTLRSQIDSYRCIYCEKQFPDMAILKKHMKSKGHFKINSHNSTYDRFYIVNYMLPGTTWHDLAGELGELGELEISSDHSWDDLDDLVDMRTTCCLCEHQADSPEAAIEHMDSEHGFDLFKLFDTFYDGVKVVNYLRVCWRDCLCGFCRQEFTSSELLAAHFEGCPKKFALSSEWKELEFMFPFYEDDNLLSILE